MVERQVTVGLATAPDLLLARQGLAQARFDLEATVAEILAARGDLLTACGVPANGFALESDQVALVPQIALNYLLFDFGRREANDDAAR
ncbi:MAG: hypothetical protein ACYSUU_07150, partial [Planctomycetota bacterium]